MNTVYKSEPRIIGVTISEDTLSASLEDGRTISVPLAWSWRLLEATPAERNNYTIIGNGIGIHWPDIDEDISANGMLFGIPAQRTKNRESA
jgi:hypothetical protein|uniref:DUF2442 domain-containing protein n=1 Tax=Chlorobium chlorochromatii (strain CaD3) TaxID=340177 RepID=Q3AR83_CHLCH